MSEKFSENQEIYSNKDIASAETEAPLQYEQILKSVDNFIKTRLHFAHKNNEGMQALIFKLDMRSDLSVMPSNEGKLIENYLGDTKSVKVLKIASVEMADQEYDWHFQAYSLYDALPEEEKENYAGIPKPHTNQNIDINEKTKAKLNNQNAKLTGNNASVMVMDWIEGEDLLTRVFRMYLEEVPAYEDVANNPNAGYAELLNCVANDFRTRGINFNDLTDLEQYKKLLGFVTKHDKVPLNNKQKTQIQNTLNLLHSKGIHHNDLHMRNILLNSEEDDRPYIIDFGRSGVEGRMNKNDIKDSFLINFLNEFKTSHFQNEQLRRGLQSDIQRIIDKDKDFQFALKDVKKLNGTELIQYLEKESDQWRYDGWRVKRFAAVVDQLKVLDPDKADLVREFLKTKKNNLPAESQQVIELIE